MAEHLPRHPGEGLKDSVEQEVNSKAEHHVSPVEELRQKHEQAERLGEVRRHAEHEAKSSEQIIHEFTPKIHHSQHEEARINRELKEMAYQRLLTRARRHMSPYSRMMSHVIHQPAINNVSEFTGKTIGRPSGIIGGGLVALIGTSIYYYIAKHYGYNYNPFAFVALVAAGFVLGWALELLYKLFKVLK